MDFKERLIKMLGELPAGITDEMTRFATVEFLRGRDFSAAMNEAVEQGKAQAFGEKIEGTIEQKQGANHG